MRKRPFGYLKTFLTCVLIVCSSRAMQLYAQAAPAPTPSAPQMEFVFEEIVMLGAGYHPGATPWGERNIVPITGGTFSGPNIKGKILPGGWDWQLASKTGFNRIQADYMLQTDDGVIINIVNKGTMGGPGEPGAKPSPVYTSPVFEAPIGRYSWLNEGAYVGTLEVTNVDGKFAVRIRIYKAR